MHVGSAPEPVCSLAHPLCTCRNYRSWRLKTSPGLLHSHWPTAALPGFTPNVYLSRHLIQNPRYRYCGSAGHKPARTCSISHHDVEEDEDDDEADEEEDGEDQEVEAANDDESEEEESEETPRTTRTIVTLLLTSTAAVILLLPYPARHPRNS